MMLGYSAHFHRDTHNIAAHFNHDAHNITSQSRCLWYCKT